MMNDESANPVRLKDRHDQPDLVERIAGQAARDLPDPAPLSAGTLARIAMRIEEVSEKPRGLGTSRVLVAASVLLGMVAVASAARMDLMPRWITKMVGIASQPAEEKPPLPAKPRSPVKKIEAPVPPPVADPALASEGATSLKAVDAVIDGASPPKVVQAAVPEAKLAARKTLAMVGVQEEGRGLKGDGHGHDHGHDHDYGHDYGHGYPLRGLREGQPTQPDPARFAPAHRGPGVLAKTEMPTGPAAPSPARATAGDERPGPGLGRPAVAPSEAPRFPSPTHAFQPQAPVPPVPLTLPSERPAPPAPPASVPAQALPTPAPVTPAPTHSPAARHLKEVVHALRVERAPRTALDLLDRHAHELAGNAFAEEALLLRVEALLALKQQPTALHILDGMSLANAATSSVLLLTRGQLRASADRCAEAVADFDLALARTLRPSKQALLGRAQCKQKLGDPQGAQADLDRLHREFPGETGP